MGLCSRVSVSRFFLETLCLCLVGNRVAISEGLLVVLLGAGRVALAPCVALFGEAKKNRSETG